MVPLLLLLLPWCCSPIAVGVSAQKEEAEELAEALRVACATPKGQKKDTCAVMPRGYHPPAVEAAWWAACSPQQWVPTPRLATYGGVCPEAYHSDSKCTAAA